MILGRFPTYMAAFANYTFFVLITVVKKIFMVIAYFFFYFHWQHFKISKFFASHLALVTIFYLNRRLLFVVNSFCLGQALTAITEKNIVGESISIDIKQDCISSYLFHSANSSAVCNSLLPLCVDLKVVYVYLQIAIFLQYPTHCCVPATLCMLQIYYQHGRQHCSHEEHKKF
jgi:hypothetical protein